MTDYEEVLTYETDPWWRDMDGDGLSDYDEVIVWLTDPDDGDTDGDVWTSLGKSTAGSFQRSPTGVDVFLLHGFGVLEPRARGWGAETFKRLWQSGSNARFWMVTWNGDAGVVSGFNYQGNVYNAFLTAPTLAAYVNTHGTGSKVVMAHSLGNMVVSSAILIGRRR